MIARRIAGFGGPALVTAWVLSAPVLSAVPSASAGSCPGVEVVFARGTGEPPGVGPIGQAFVAALRNRVAPMSVGVYAVNYPASNDWPTGVDGVKDAAAHVVSMAANCPDTKMVLAGYSQGAAVAGFVTSDAVPDGVDPATVPKPLRPEVADRVAAVVLFGEPNVRAMNFLGEPAVLIGRRYNDKTIKVCAPDDAVCSDGLEFAEHTTDTYAADGIIDQGADFAAGRLQTSSGGPVSVVRAGGGFGS
jgi:cutinase